MRRGKQDAAIIVVEIATRRLSLAGRDLPQSGPIDVHHVLLVAAASVSRRLKDQLLPAPAEIRFRVLAAECELGDVAEM